MLCYIFVAENTFGEVVVKPDSQFLINNFDKKVDPIFLGTHADLWERSWTALEHRRGGITLQKVAAHLEIQEDLDDELSERDLGVQPLGRSPCRPQRRVESGGPKP